MYKILLMKRIFCAKRKEYNEVTFPLKTCSFLFDLFLISSFVPQMLIIWLLCRAWQSYVRPSIEYVYNVRVLLAL
jgi:hypothetical protein